LLPETAEALPVTLVGLRFPLEDGKFYKIVKNDQDLARCKADIYNKWVYMLANMIMERSRGKPFERVGHYFSLYHGEGELEDSVVDTIITGVIRNLNTSSFIQLKGVMIVSPLHISILFHPSGANHRTLDINDKDFRAAIFGIESFISVLLSTD